MKKPAILLLNALDIYGGGEFFVYQLAKMLASRGYNVYVSCRKDNLLYSKCKDEGVKVFAAEYPENSGTGKLWKITRKLAAFIKENNIDIVHSNTNYDRTAGAFAAKLSGVKHVTNVHSLHKISHNITHWLRNKFLVHHFIADGSRAKELLIKEDKIPESRITSIYLGIDPGQHKKDPEAGKKIRNEFGIKDDEILIGNTARMVPFKGQEYLLKAFGSIHNDHLKCRLMIVGDGELSGYLGRLAEELGVNDKVIFPGFRNDLKSMYSAFDIYAHTSVEGGGEAFPFAILHALAHELPLVITKVGDMPAMVEERINGFVLEDKDVKGITEKLMILCGDEKMRKEMGRKSYELLLKKFTVDKMTNDIEKVYDWVLSL